MHYRLKNEAGETQQATECFECAPKQSRTKTYPVCTIRNTPDKPIHCIVWAKELLFARLFGRYRTLSSGPFDLLYRLSQVSCSAGQQSVLHRDHIFCYAASETTGNARLASAGRLSLAG